MSIFKPEETLLFIQIIIIIIISKAQSQYKDFDSEKVNK